MISRISDDPLSFKVLSKLRAWLKELNKPTKVIGLREFLGPVAALTYTTLTSYLSTGAESLKKVFKKAFNPVRIAIANSKIADYVRNNKMKVLGLLGIGVLSATTIGLFSLIPSLTVFSGALQSGVSFAVPMVMSIEYLITRLRKEAFNPLTSRQIERRSKRYEKKLQTLCIQYALKFKKILIEEYGYNVLELDKNIRLTYHFRFPISISRIPSRQKVIGSTLLQKVRDQISQEFMTLEKNLERIRSYEKVTTFLNEYIEFSKYIEGVSRISNIRYEERTGRIIPENWLFENLRLLFPKRFNLPLTNNLLSWFAFGSSRKSPGNILWSIRSLSKLLEIDFRINKLSVKDFTAKGVSITGEGLKALQKSVSYLIYFYIFGGYHDTNYVSETTAMGWEVGKKFWTPEYDIIRALFFATAETNGGKPLTIGEISKSAGLGISQLGSHLTGGFGFGDTLNKYISYYEKLSKNRPQGSDPKIFTNAKSLLDGYSQTYRSRNKAYFAYKKIPTVYQDKVHRFFESFLNMKFTPEVSLRLVVSQKYITAIDDQGINQRIIVHTNYRLDGYKELTKSLKKYLGLDDKWIGIGFEAQSEYFHHTDRQIKIDRKKSLICKEKNILLLEIWDSWKPSTWGDKILMQIEEKTGVRIPPSKLGALVKFLGIKS